MDEPAPPWPSWRVAMEQALYGPDGFYRVEQPASHFRTSVHTSPLFAGAIVRLVDEISTQLGWSEPIEVVDMGAGRGELLVALSAVVPAAVRLTGVDVAARPDGLPARIRWRHDLPRVVRGLLIANEWLDNVPLDVAEVDPDGRSRLVRVDPRTGAERLAEVVTGADAEWLRRHWPLDGATPGSRAEIGTSRDVAWSTAVSSLGAGLAIAIDYHHTRDARPPLGTLKAFRAGREVAPVPDGSRDLTAHVAFDACAAAVPASGAAVTTTIRSQREALRGLGIRGGLPPYELARSDPSGYLRGLASASEAATLMEPKGLGAFGWLSHARGMPMPAALGG